MLKKLLFGLVALMVLVLGGGFLLPSKFRVERSVTIHASPEAVYVHVANLRRWQEWAPWNARQYPGSEWSFAGPEEGVGAIQSWRGREVGNGSLILREADPRAGVAYEMSMEHGRHTMRGRLAFEPEGGSTRVTWVDEGDLGANPLAHYLVLLIQPTLGRDLEEGLARLKERVEESPAPVRPAPTPAPVEVAPVAVDSGALPRVRALPPVPEAVLGDGGVRVVAAPGEALLGDGGVRVVAPGEAAGLGDGGVRVVAAPGEALLGDGGVRKALAEEAALTDGGAGVVAAPEEAAPVEEESPEASPAPAGTVAAPVQP